MDGRKKHELRKCVNPHIFRKLAKPGYVLCAFVEAGKGVGVWYEDW